MRNEGCDLLLCVFLCTLPLCRDSVAEYCAFLAHNWLCQCSIYLRLHSHKPQCYLNKPPCQIWNLITTPRGLLEDIQCTGIVILWYVGKWGKYLTLYWNFTNPDVCLNGNFLSIYANFGCGNWRCIEVWKLTDFGTYDSILCQTHIL